MNVEYKKDKRFQSNITGTGKCKPALEKRETVGGTLDEDGFSPLMSKVFWALFVIVTGFVTVFVLSSLLLPYFGEDFGSSSRFVTALAWTVVLLLPVIAVFLAFMIYMLTYKEVQGYLKLLSFIGEFSLFRKKAKTVGQAGPDRREP